MPYPSTVHISAVENAPKPLPLKAMCELKPFVLNNCIPPQVNSSSSIKTTIDKLGQSLVRNPNLLLETGMEMRSSLFLQQEIQLPKSLYFRFSPELTPSQLRLQWDHQTEGFRADITNSLGLRFGTNSSFEGGYRSSYASGHYKQVEEERVGYYQLNINKLSLMYFNDHRFIFFPMGGGTDQGDTAGFNIGYKLNLNLAGLLSGSSLTEIGTHLHIATGIPDINQTEKRNGRTYYTNVKFNEISRGVLSASATTYNHRYNLFVRTELGIDSGAIGNLFQNQLVHRNLHIAEFPKPSYIQPYFGISILIPLK